MKCDTIGTEKHMIDGDILTDAQSILWFENHCILLPTQ